jgi:diaminopimelate epimerase
MCLNGIRCAAYYVWNNFFAPQKKLSFMTKAGIVECTPYGKTKVSVNIKNPTSIDKPQLKKALTKKFGKSFSLLNIGNNHLCIKMQSISKVDLEKIYKELPKSAKDIEINLSIYKKEKNKISIRTYENGVGETLSCGSASLSVASIYTNKAKSPIEVGSFGGKLNFKKYNSGILMTGPTSFTFKGNIDG